MREKACSLVESMGFQAAVMVVIVANALTLGLQTYPLPPEVQRALLVFDDLCLLFYVIEAALKIYAHRGAYFHDGWNIFDLVIILVSLIPSWLLPIPTQVARIIRVFRAFKAFRLIGAFRNMRVIVEALISSIPGVIWTAVLMGIVFYVYAVIGTVAFAGVYPDHFGSLHETLYTLFQVMTLESWSEGVARPVIAQIPLASVYFVSFVMISAFIMVNVIVGIVVGAIEDSRAKLAEEIEAEKHACEPADESALHSELAQVREHLAAVERLLENREKASS